MEVKKRALKILKEEEVKIISENQDRDVFIKVGKKTVRIFKKPGRTLVSCSCENHPRFCIEQSLCKHKLAGLKFWMDEKEYMSNKECIEYLLHELKVIQKLWYENNKTFLSSIDNSISFCEQKLKNTPTIKGCGKEFYLDIMSEPSTCGRMSENNLYVMYCKECKEVAKGKKDGRD